MLITRASIPRERKATSRKIRNLSIRLPTSISPWLSGDRGRTCSTRRRSISPVTRGLRRATPTPRSAYEAGAESPPPSLSSPLVSSGLPAMVGGNGQREELQSQPRHARLDAGPNSLDDPLGRVDLLWVGRHVVDLEQARRGVASPSAIILTAAAFSLLGGMLQERISLKVPPPVNFAISW